MNDANYEPDWGAVLLAPDMKIDGAVALSMGVDPAKLVLWKSRASRSDVQEYERRLGLVKQWRLPGPNAIAVGYGVGGTPTIYLREFAERLVQTGWSIPTQLMTWATRREQGLPLIQVDDGSTPNLPSEGPYAGESGDAASEVASHVADPRPLQQTKRAARSQKKREMYDTWRRLAAEHCRTDDGRRRTREQIAEKIADDDRARDPLSGKQPASSSVPRRLNELYPGWAEKSWAEREGRKKVPAAID